MTALSANIDRPVRIPPGGIRTAKVKLAGYTNRAGGNVAFTCYKGAVIACDITDTDGYFGPMDFNAATGDIFGGIAMSKQAVTSVDTADGSVEITVAINVTWGFPVGGCAITDLGAIAYASDDGTITPASSNALNIGTIVDVDATYVWVELAWMKLTA